MPHIVIDVTKSLSIQTRLSEEEGISEDQQGDIGTGVHLDKKTRDQFMDVLLKRELDVSSYTRSAVIK